MEVDKTGILVVLLVSLIIAVIAFTLIYFGYSKLGLLGAPLIPIISYFINRYRLHKK